MYRDSNYVYVDLCVGAFYSYKSLVAGIGRCQDILLWFSRAPVSEIPNILLFRQQNLKLAIWMSQSLFDLAFTSYIFLEFRYYFFAWALLAIRRVHAFCGRPLIA